MRKQIHDYHVTNVLATGIVIPDEIFIEGQCVRPAKDNQDLIDEYARQADPNYRSMERAKRRFERVEARRKELERRSYPRAKRDS